MTAGGAAPRSGDGLGGTAGGRVAVDALLGAARIPASVEERAALAVLYPALRRSADALGAPWGEDAGDPFHVAGQATKRRSRYPASDPPPTHDPEPFTIAALSLALREGRRTSRDLVQAALDGMDRIDDRLGSMMVRFPETALEAADRADADLAAGRDRGALQGIPMVIKDILTTVEGPTRAHSLVPSPLAEARTDAAAVVRLRARGAVILGKASTSEYALGRPDPTAGLPDSRNPWDLDRWPGGSSSGTAGAVAGGLVPAGLGTDSGGSIRIPSAFCGITGLKPTFGRVPVEGCIPLAPSMDTIGPMARSAYDCALVFDALIGAGAGPASGSTVDALVGDLDGIRVGVERASHLTAPELEPEVPERVEECVGVLSDLGAGVREVRLDGYGAIRTASLVVMYGEAFAVHRDMLRTHWLDYGSETRMALASGALYDIADYVRAQHLGDLVRRRVARLLETVDVVVMPTLGMVAPRLDEDFRSRLMALVFTSAWNLARLPALTVPIGFGHARMPLGIQIVGRAGDEATVLRVGDAFQRRTAWHLQRAPYGVWTTEQPGA